MEKAFPKIIYDVMGKGWLWINFTVLYSQLTQMFTGILRIGPLVILEWILLCAAIAIRLLEALPQCYVYTLCELGFIIFLIEMYTSLNIMKRSPQMRKKYIKERIEEQKPWFYGRLAWDKVNILVIIGLLYSALVADGIQLTSNLKGISPGAF
jgi:hypothetical protein